MRFTDSCGHVALSAITWRHQSGQYSIHRVAPTALVVMAERVAHELGSDIDHLDHAFVRHASLSSAALNDGDSADLVCALEPLLEHAEGGALTLLYRAVDSL